MPTTFANTIDGNEIYAKRAEQDKDGNQIDTTYAKSAGLAAVATSGSYNDLSDKPSIPSPVTVDQTYNASSTNAQSGTAVAGAIATVRQVPSSTSADADKVLKVDSLGVPSWAIVPSQSTGLFEAVYGTSTYVDIAQAITDKKIVYCRISPNTSSRMAFLAYIGTGSTGKIEFQYYRSNSNLSADDSVFVYAVDQNNTWTTTERSAGIKTQVNSDWNAASGAAQILNKPTIPSGEDLVPAHSASDSGRVLGVNASGNTEWVAGGSGTQVQSNWTESDTSDPSYIQNKPNLATVATSGSYNDLSNKPTIPSVPVQDVEVNGTSVLNAQGVAEVSVPTKTSDLNNDSGFITASQIPAQAQADWTESDSSDPSYIQNKPNLATVATSGSYNDLSNKPTIPAAQVQSNWTESDTTDPSYIQNKPTIPSGEDLVPSHSSSDSGKVLGVNSNGNTEWVAGGGGGLPSSTSADAGKVLTVNSSGNAAWDALATTAEIEAIVV